MDRRDMLSAYVTLCLKTNSHLGVQPEYFSVMGVTDAGEPILDVLGVVQARGQLLSDTHDAVAQGLRVGRQIILDA